MERAPPPQSPPLLSRKDKRKLKAAARGFGPDSPKLNAAIAQQEFSVVRKKLKKDNTELRNHIQRMQGERATMKQVCLHTLQPISSTPRPSMCVCCNECCLQGYETRLMEIDFSMRLQAEEHVHERATLETQKSTAQLALNRVYWCDRESHKATKRAIDAVARVQEETRLSQGALSRMAQVARQAVAEVPATKRATLKEQLARPSVALSASQYALSNALKSATREVVAASEQVRTTNAKVCANMGF